MPRILIQKEKKEYVPELERDVTIVKSHQYFVEDATKPFSTQHGTVSVKDLKAKDGSVIKTSQGKEFIIFTPSFIDVWRRLRKQAQTIIPKDIGLIIAETGIDKNSVVVDGGAGSGALACYLGHLVKKVTTYEIREDFLQTIKDTIKHLGLKNVTLKHGDLAKATEKNADLFTIDLPDATAALPAAVKSVRVGGFIVAYCTQVSQVIAFSVAARKNEHLQFIRTSELIDRTWIVDEQRSRPDNKGIGHTAFLTFVRRIR
ncbi:MAG TPA: rRNA adenine N-6-methyltransferase family protein [Candidatus Binatia bacterium]|nr:rRNA adenine N-6-methyltransferase family protein [Candidatus Binatia bacterium]